MGAEKLIPDDYLGNGVYASFDGYHIVLDLRAQDHTTRIALEPEVIQRLIRFRDRAYAALLGGLQAGDDAHAGIPIAYIPKNGPCPACKAEARCRELEAQVVDCEECSGLRQADVDELVALCKKRKQRIKRLQRLAHQATRGERCPCCDAAIGLHGDRATVHLDDCSYQHCRDEGDLEG